MTVLMLPAGDVDLEGELLEPDGARGAVVFAHGSGSGRRSPRNRQVAAALGRDGFATLLFDLLTPEEEIAELHTAHLRFNIPMLAGRLGRVVAWLRAERPELPVGLFGASTGAAAALVAAAERPDDVAAVVSRGGRPDLAAQALDTVRAPTLLIVGERDPEVLALNRRALERMGGAGHGLTVVPHATHLFEEPGALEEVARLSSEWFGNNLVE